MANIHLNEAAARRLLTLQAQDPAVAGLRVAVLGGGCSGFQYDIALAGAPQGDDLVIEDHGARLFVDAVSVPLLDGSVVEWVDELIGASFKVKNPNAVSSCGCGVSFSL
jgi:iron-sulfur cluster assembly accessory protein